MKDVGPVFDPATQVTLQELSVKETGSARNIVNSMQALSLCVPLSLSEYKKGTAFNVL